MRTLQDRLNSLREAFQKSAPEAARAIMKQRGDELRDSGIMDGIPKVGDPLVPFALSDTDGTSVRSDELLAHGPLVVSVYRGVW